MTRNTRKPVRARWGGPGDAYVVFDKVKAGEALAVSYPVVAFEQAVTVGVQSGPETVHIFWRGNSVVDIQPRAERFALFGPGL